jgi:hypothetical protein
MKSSIIDFDLSNHLLKLVPMKGDEVVATVGALYHQLPLYFFDLLMMVKSTSSHLPQTFPKSHLILLLFFCS